MKHIAAAFLSGIVFAIGLGISEMTRPPKILGFLNLAGEWDPTLLVVFGAATVTYLIGYWFFIPGSTREPLEVYLEKKEKLKPRVFMGAAIFGIGWGLIGLCPGPAVTDFFSGEKGIFLFLFGLFSGMYFVKRLPLS